MMDHREPYIFKTTDLGKTWTKITGNLPTGHPLAYVLTVAAEPGCCSPAPATLLLLDDGGGWTQFKDGLPAAPVTWIAPQQQYHDVVLSTYGRGIFLLRDISTLEQPEKQNASEVLYARKPGVRQARSGSAEFLYRLASAPAAPVRIEIVAGNGKVVRTLTVPARAGLNRAAWDLRHEPPQQVAPHHRRTTRTSGRGPVQGS
jgi:hypothetical protein